jgi:putative inorganic carbon (HCO3(-)) transporter
VTRRAAAILGPHALLRRSAGATVRGAPSRQLVPAAAVGAVLGAGAAYGAAGPAPRAELLLLLVVVPTAIAVVGDARRVLLGILLLDIPLQFNVFFGYRDDVDAMAALAGWSISATSLALAGLYAMWIAELLVVPGRASRPRLAAATVPFAFFAVLCASVLVAGDRTVASFQLSMYALMLLLFVYLASTVRRREDVHFIVVMLLAGACLEGILAMAMQFGGAGLQLPGLSTRESVYRGASRAGGTIGSPNMAGAYFAFMFALSGALILATGVSRRLKRLALVASVLALVALVLTLSRGAWIACGVSILVLLRGPHGRMKWPAVLGLALVMALALVPLREVITNRVVSSDHGAAAGRLPLIEMAWQMIVDHPLLGVGANNFVLELPRYAGGDFASVWLSSVHHKYLLIWSEAGFAALLAFVTFVGQTIVRGWRGRAAQDPLLAAVSLGLAAAVAGHAVHMNFDIFADGTPVLMLWLAAGLLASPALMDERSAR